MWEKRRKGRRKIRRKRVGKEKGRGEKKNEEEESGKYFPTLEQKFPSPPDC